MWGVGWLWMAGVRSSCESRVLTAACGVPGRPGERRLVSKAGAGPGSCWQMLRGCLGGSPWHPLALWFPNSHGFAQSGHPSLCPVVRWLPPPTQLCQQQSMVDGRVLNCSSPCSCPEGSRCAFSPRIGAHSGPGRHGGGSRNGEPFLCPGRDVLGAPVSPSALPLLPQGHSPLRPGSRRSADCRSLWKGVPVVQRPVVGVGFCGLSLRACFQRG